MELTQLKQFKAVAETENIVDAANVLKISQPALTKAIRNLENELNTPLFDRTNHKLVLNQYGKLVLEYVNEIFADLEDMFIDLKYSVGYEKSIRVCSSINAILMYIVPRFGLEFSDYYCYHQFRDKVEKFQHYIEEDIFDIVISTEKIVTETIESTVLVKDWVVISVPDTHPLYTKDVIELWELDGESFLRAVNTIKNPLPQLFEEMLKSKGVTIDIIQQADLLSMWRFQENKEVLSYASYVGALYSDEGEHRRFIPIDYNDNVSLTYYISWSRKKAQEVSGFVSWIKKQFNDYMKLDELGKG